MKKFNLGDEVWFASTRAIETWVTCPHCFGQGALTVILGDESRVSIDCAGCSHGFNRTSTGKVQTFEYQIKVERTTISNVCARPDGSVEYNHVSEADHFFETKEEAQVRAKELKAIREAEEQARFKHLKEHQKRTWSWNATYHRNQLKRAQADVAYHTAKLNVAKVKAKEEKNEAHQKA